VNIVHCVLTYVNGKMIPVETVKNGGEQGIKENSGGDELKYDIHCKNFCKCHNLPPLSTAMKN
jgi:hypothetical protein